MVHKYKREVVADNALLDLYHVSRRKARRSHIWGAGREPLQRTYKECTGLRICSTM